MLPYHKKICGYWFRCMQDRVLSPAFGTGVCKAFTAGAGTKQRHKTLPQWPGGAVKCLFPGKSRESVRNAGNVLPSGAAALHLTDGSEQPSVGAQRFTAGTLSKTTWSSGRFQSFSPDAPRAEMISDTVQGHQQEPVLTLIALRSFSARFVNLGNVGGAQKRADLCLASLQWSKNKYSVLKNWSLKLAQSRTFTEKLKHLILDVTQKVL